MNIKGQLKKLFTVLYISSFVFGAAVEVSPGTIPAGATNSNHFYQVLNITFSDNGSGSWADGEDIVINFPPTIQLAETDGAAYNDEVAVSVSRDDLGASAHSSTTAGTIVIDLASASKLVAGDKLQLVFPISTTAGSSGSASYTVLYGGGDEETGGSSATVTFTASAPMSAAFSAAYTGGDATSGTGNYYPAQLRATTSLLVKVFANVTTNDKFVLNDGTNNISFEVNQGVTTADGTKDGDGDVIVGTQGLTDAAGIAARIAAIINLVTEEATNGYTLNITASVSGYNTSAISLEQDAAGGAGNTTPTTTDATAFGVAPFAGGGTSTITAALPTLLTELTAIPRSASATITATDGNAPNGMAEAQKMTLISSDLTTKVYRMVDGQGSVIATGTVLADGDDIGDATGADDGDIAV